MLVKAIWSLKCQNRSAEVAQNGNFRGFFNFSQKWSVGSCSYSLQMFSRPIPIIWRARIGCIISVRVTSKNRTVCRGPLERCAEEEDVDGDQAEGEAAEETGVSRMITWDDQ